MSAVINWLGGNKLYVILAVSTMFSYFWLFQNKKKLNINDGMSFLLAVLHTLIGLFCVKVFAFLEAGADAEAAGSMSLYGAVFFLPVVYFAAAKLTKRNMADIFDIFTVCVVFTLMCARVNCLLGGCCLGKPFFGSESLRWPTRELEIVFYLILLAWLGRKVGKADSKGKIYPLYMMSYGIFRFIVEWFRETEHPVGYLHISHIWSLVALIIGLIIYRTLTKKQQTGKKRRNAKRIRSTREEKT